MIAVAIYNKVVHAGIIIEWNKNTIAEVVTGEKIDTKIQSIKFTSL